MDTNLNAVWDYRDPYEWMRLVSTSQLPPAMISVAITGGAQGKESNPNLPETVEEQIQAAYEAYQEGAASVHIHVRNPENTAQSVCDEEVFSRVNYGIREKCPGMIVNNSTAGGPTQSAYEKIAPVRAKYKPDMASLNPGPFMMEQKLKAREGVPFPAEARVNDICTPITYGDIRYWAEELKTAGIKPEIEIFNAGHFWSVNHLIDRGLLEAPYILQFVMGFQTGTYPTPWNVMALLNDIPKGSIFFVPGMGVYQLPMNMMALVLGGHVRVGLEDNVYYKRGELAVSAAQQVERIRRIAEEINRPIATIEQSRQMMGLSPA